MKIQILLITLCGVASWASADERKIPWIQTLGREEILSKVPWIQTLGRDVDERFLTSIAATILGHLGKMRPIGREVDDERILKVEPSLFKVLRRGGIGRDVEDERFLRTIVATVLGHLGRMKPIGREVDDERIVKGDRPIFTTLRHGRIGREVDDERFLRTIVATVLGHLGRMKPIGREVDDERFLRTIVATVLGHLGRMKPIGREVDDERFLRTIVATVLGHLGRMKPIGREVDDERILKVEPSLFKVLRRGGIGRQVDDERFLRTIVATVLGHLGRMKPIGREI